MRASPSSSTPMREPKRIPQSCRPPTSPPSTRRSSRRILDRRRSRPRSAVLAVAGPVDGDEIPLTNCPWVVQAARHDRATSASRDVVVLNDFEAQALAVVALGEEHMEKIGAGDAGSRRQPRRARPRHRPRRRRADPRLRPLDSGARRRRPYGYRPAHAARLRGLSASGDRSKAAFRASRSCAAAASSTSIARSPRPTASRRASRRRPRSPARRSARRTRSPRRRWRCSSPVSARTAGDLALVFKSRGGVFLTGGIAQKIVPALQDAATSARPSRTRRRTAR